MRFFVVALLLFAIGRAEGQRVSGIVRDSASSLPVAGAVVSVLDSSRQTIVRALSDGMGRYSLPLAANAAQLRVVRLGFLPKVVTLPRVRDSYMTIDIHMRRAPTLLATVTVNDRRQCDGEGVKALSLWEQARAGLLTAIVAREALPAQTTLMGYQRIISVGNGRVTQQTERLVTATTSRPFLSADEPHTLAERGYAEAMPQAFRFKAPDADVLLDDSFAATHCFSVHTSDAAHIGAIGLGFDPLRSRDTLVDVSGTLWIDLTVPALRSMEFVWTDRGGVLRRGGAGGDLQFHTMSNGVSFIERWSLRLPVVDATPSSPGSGRFTFRAPGRLHEMSETGGVVLSAVWRDGSTWKTSLGPLTGTITEAGTHAPLPGVLVGLEANGEPFSTDSSGRFSIFPMLPGRYMVQVIDSAFTGFVAPRSESRQVEVGQDEALDVRFELPSRMSALRSRCQDLAPASATSALLGRLVDSTGAAPSLRNLRISASWAEQNRNVDVDEYGRFVVCGLPREQDIVVAINHDGVTRSTTSVRINAGRTIASIDWIVDLR